MMELKDRIAALLARNEGATQADLCRITKLSSASVSDWMTGKTLKMSAGPARLLADHFGCNQNWLMDGFGQPDWRDEGHAIGEGLSHRANGGIPIGLVSQAPIQDVTNIAWEALVTADLTRLVRAALPDDAMGRDFPKGTILEFDPQRKPLAGWPCLVRDGGGNFYCRDYIKGAGEHWQAVARQAGYLPLDSVTHDLQYVGRMSSVHFPDSE